MMTASAHRNASGEWVIQQVYYQDGKRISRKRLLEQVKNNTLLQELVQLDPAIGRLIEEAKRERCVPGYSANERFYDYYKPRITQLVGWKVRKEGILCSMDAYDAVYHAVYALLPGDEWDLYPDGIMPNGAFCPTWQGKYGREYP